MISNAKIIFNNWFISVALISYIGALGIALNRDSVGNKVMLITLAIILIFKIFRGDKYSVRMRKNAGKMRTRMNPYTDTFYAVAYQL